MKLCLKFFKFSKHCFRILTIKTCRSGEGSSSRFSRTQGLMTFPQSPEPRFSSTFILQPTVWHNHTILFAILKGKCYSFLHCVNIMYSLFEILNKCKFMCGTNSFNRENVKAFAIVKNVCPVLIFPSVHFKNHMLTGAATASIGGANPTGWSNGRPFLTI